MTLEMSTQGEVDPLWLAGHVRGRGPNDIAKAVLGLILSGDLPPGSRLPTLRTLSDQVGASQGTLASAWGILREQGFIATRRRGGTIVSLPAERDASLESSRPRDLLDLSTSTPDQSLIPSLKEALSSGLAYARDIKRDAPDILDELCAVIEPTWPFRAEAFTIGGGSSESLLLAIKSVAKRGQVVAVEDPSEPRLHAILERLGITAIPVACDMKGPRPDALASAIRHAPVAFILQTTGQVPLGITLGQERAAELAAVVRNAPDLRIVESDWIGPIGHYPPGSLGAWFPDRTVMIRAFCKAFGTELRSNVIGGAKSIIADVRRERVEGLGITSRILQGALLSLLTAPVSVQAVVAARSEYRRRGQKLISDLQRRGFSLSAPSDGLFLRIPVKSEATAMLALAERGIIVSPGSRCFLEPEGEPFIITGVTALPSQHDAMGNVAAALIKAIDYERHIFHD